MTDDDGYTDIALNPSAQAQVDEIISEANSGGHKPKPVISLPPDGTVILSGGSRLDERPVREAVVGELTGADEERLAKSRANDTRWFNVLLQCGTVEIDGKPVTEEMLNGLLVGDRELLALGIRSATYGPDVEVGEIYCPVCNQNFDAVVSLETDVGYRPMTGEPTFEVKLRKGGVALVRLPNGADQTAYTEDPDLTDAERNSLLLSRCVETLPGDLGDQMPVAGFPSLVRSLGISDRRTILSEIDNRMPGPRYDEVEIEHAECGTKIPAPPLGLVPLFPGL